MAINKNHEFEDLDNIKCAIVEKNVSADRVQFLKEILSYNHYEVVVVASPAPKAAPVVAKTTDESGNLVETAPAPEAVAPSTFTVGVTDLRFNSINAIFGRLLHTPDGHVVTLAYWQQKDAFSDDTIPYYDHDK